MRVYWKHFNSEQWVRVCVRMCVCVWQIWKHFMVSRRGLCDWTSYVTPGLKRLCTTARASASHPDVLRDEKFHRIHHTVHFLSKLLILSAGSCRRMSLLGNLWLRSIINTRGFLELRCRLISEWICHCYRKRALNHITNPLMCVYYCESST